ncbi:hypothetical protein EW145_g3185 [Phellinidium pouzarii]|uniref:Aminoglycoside phosphotransferase domain-containing protein n=1 Tax=Phellinidium pouzarii TaxID=167371 RepID=A0A4S4L8B5_9AGAM|nr:hypothetical protein EW145_g3185 [Phellinidium pouzarii]
MCLIQAIVKLHKYWCGLGDKKRDEPSTSTSPTDSLTNEKIIELFKTCPAIYTTPFLQRRVVRIAPDTVVKCYSGITPAEVMTMRLVQSQTTIPVPAVRRVFKSDAEDDYVVMEYVEGETLYTCWEKLTIWTKVKIACKLWWYIQQLRAVRTKDVETPGPIDGGPCDGNFFTIYGAGPFQTYSEMSAWFAHMLSVSHRMKKAPLDTPPFDDTKPLVLTHQDLHMQNIILGSDGRLWLIDWGQAGFYPIWFEYASMNACPEPPPRDWRFITRFVAGRYRKQAQFMASIAWALSYGYQLFTYLK